MSTISARDLNQDVSAAKRAAKDGPVVITDRGDPAFVLMTYADYRRIVGGPSIRETLRMKEDVDIEFEPVISRDLARPAEL